MVFAAPTVFDRPSPKPPMRSSRAVTRLTYGVLAAEIQIFSRVFGYRPEHLWRVLLPHSLRYHYRTRVPG